MWPQFNSRSEFGRAQLWVTRRKNKKALVHRTEYTSGRYPLGERGVSIHAENRLCQVGTGYVCGEENIPTGSILQIEPKRFDSGYKPEPALSRLGLFDDMQVKRSMIIKKIPVNTRSFTSYILHALDSTDLRFGFSGPIFTLITNQDVTPVRPLGSN